MNLKTRRIVTRRRAISCGSVLALTLLASGCTGGGDDDPRGISGFDDGLGSGLAGRFVGTDWPENVLTAIDVSSGRYSRLSGDTELAPVIRESSNTRLRLMRDRSVSSGVLLTAEECARDVTCFVFLDGNGNPVSRFDEATEFPGPGKVSFDGMHVAVNLTDREGGNSTMTIYTRDGQFVSNWSQSGAMNSDGPYDWLPDGRLVYAIEGNALLGDVEPIGIIITAPVSTVPDRRITLPERYQEGVIQSIESSPDGSRLLLNVETRVGPLRPLLLDLATLDLYTPLSRADGTLIDVDSVTWGTDSGSFFAEISSTELLSGPGLGPGTEVVFLGSFASVFSVVADGQSYPMPITAEDASDAVRLIPTDTPGSPERGPGAGAYRLDETITWIP